MNGKTPGYKTTEFWMQVASQAGVLWAAIDGFIPPKYAAIVTVVGTAIYTVSRNVYKAFIEVKAITNASPSTQVDAQTVVVNK